MGGYLVNFGEYTMAMTGLIFFALMVYKKFTTGCGLMNSKNKYLGVEETISIAPRKTLYVVRAGHERFLIAGDVDKTTLISKLETNPNTTQDTVNETYHDYSSHDFKDDNIQNICYAPRQTLHANRQTRLDNVQHFSEFREKATQGNILHNMIRKINE